MLSLAYIGPGLGAGVVATVIGVIASIFLAIFGIVWYPFKRLIRRRKARRAAVEADTPPAPASGER